MPRLRGLSAVGGVEGVDVPASARPIYLQSERETVFAIAHEPHEPSRATAVLLCPPFGWDDMCSYRVRRDWAELLADRGHTVLRFDLPGSGDSAGGPRDVGRLEAWTAAVEASACWLRARVHVQQVALVGFGLAGMAACRAALRSDSVEAAVLWSVPSSGRRALRELRTFSTLSAARTAEQREREEGEAPDELAVNGYLLSAETLAELEQLELAPPAGEDTRLRRVLLLGRDGMRVEQTLAQALSTAGLEVTVADGPGYGAMMVEPQESRAPLEVFARVHHWLDADEPPRPAAASPAASGRSPHAQALPGRTTSVPWSEAPELRLQVQGAELVERPLLLPGPDGPLWGILAEPAGARARLTAVLFNAGPQRRTGPNRMWVEIARRWAARGVPTLRLDASGIGDSGGDGSGLARIAEFYKPEYVTQARATLDGLAESGLARRFLLLGLCGGAYWAAHAAVEDERVAGLLLLNPRTLVFDRRLHAARRVRELRERALLASTWRKALSGELHLARHLETGRTLVQLAAATPRRRRRRAVGPAGAQEHPLEGLFDSLRGRRCLLMFTGAEILHRELVRRGISERMERWPDVELAVLGNATDTHTLTPLWLQREVHELLDRRLEEELARLERT